MNVYLTTNEQQILMSVVSEWMQIMADGEDTIDLVDKYMQDGLGKALYKLSKGTVAQKLYKEYSNK